MPAFAYYQLKRAVLLCRLSDSELTGRFAAVGHPS